MSEQTPITTSMPQKQKHQPVWLAALAATALISGGLGGGIGAAVVAGQTPETSITQQTNTTASTASLENSDLANIVKTTSPSVVTISVVAGQNQGTGSGVVVDNQGHIVTNAHVATLGGLTNQGAITIQTSTGETAKATLVGYDPTSDLAVLKTNIKNLTPIKFANSDKTNVGEETVAIGSPLGLNGTVTTGIISALNRPITVQSSDTEQTMNTPGQVALNVIQTDAAINSGNSGGALLNANGDLIGINVAIASTGQNSGSIGVGFAIPSNLVQQVTEDLITTGKRVHGFLGVGVDDHYTTNSSFITGAEITTIEPGSPADKAGLQEGDVVTEINNTPVESATQFVASIKQNQPGAKITLTLKRDNQERTVPVTLTQQNV